MAPKSRKSVRRKLGPPDEAVLRAMGHPLRFTILSALNERVASPNDIAKEIGEDVPVVAYHVRRLRDLGALELVETVPRRGATEHYYRATVRPDLTEAEYARLPAGTRRRLVGTVLKRVTDDASRALDDGGFDHADARASWATFDLDDEAHALAITAIEELIERLQELQGAAVDRADSSEDDERTRFELGLLFFRPGDSLRRRR